MLDSLDFSSFSEINFWATTQLFIYFIPERRSEGCGTRGGDVGEVGKEMGNRGGE